VTQILKSSEKICCETGSQLRPMFTRLDKQNKAASINENYTIIRHLRFSHALKGLDRAPKLQG